MPDPGNIGDGFLFIGNHTGELFTSNAVLPAGALLFFISDSLLAYDRFTRKTPAIRLWVMVTYHLAQFGLAAGFIAALGIIP